MYEHSPSEWSGVKQEAEMALIVDNVDFPKAERYQQKYDYINDNWDSWRSSKTDKKYFSDRDIWTVAAENKVLRRPSK